VGFELYFYNLQGGAMQQREVKDMVYQIRRSLQKFAESGSQSELAITLALIQEAPDDVLDLVPNTSEPIATRSGVPLTSRALKDSRVITQKLRRAETRKKLLTRV